MDMIKYLEDPAGVDVGEESTVEYVINHKDSKLMSLKEFQDKFNQGAIDDDGYIAFIPPLSYVKK